jgi:hypothetical protein
MRLQILCAALLAASSALAQTSNPPASSPAPSVRSADPRDNPRIEMPASTGDCADTACSGTTAPRSPTSDISDSSVGTSGALAGTASSGSTTSTGRCDTLLGEERQKCLKEQAATGIVK